MNVKRRIYCVFCTIHLAICVVCVLPDRFHVIGRLSWNFINLYGGYTGAANKYGFFTPDVPNARRIRVRVLCGNDWIPVTAPVTSSESNTRIVATSSLLMLKEVEEQTAASWAAFGFNRFPCARVALALEDYYVVPAMAEYRRGNRPGWKPEHILAFMTKEQLKTVEESRR